MHLKNIKWVILNNAFFKDRSNTIFIILLGYEQRRRNISLNWKFSRGFYLLRYFIHYLISSWQPQILNYNSGNHNNNENEWHILLQLTMLSPTFVLEMWDILSEDVERLEQLIKGWQVNKVRRHIFTLYQCCLTVLLSQSFPHNFQEQRVYLVSMEGTRSVSTWQSFILLFIYN